MKKLILLAAVVAAGPAWAEMTGITSSPDHIGFGEGGRLVNGGGTRIEGPGCVIELNGPRGGVTLDGKRCQEFRVIGLPPHPSTSR